MFDGQCRVCKSVRVDEGGRLHGIHETDMMHKAKTCTTPARQPSITHVTGCGDIFT